VRSINNLIILTGFSTTGKSKVAREVARRLGWGWVDSDDEIVRLAGKGIPEVFTQDGEPRFRELERQVLARACEGGGGVIASGGGAILDPGNRELFDRSGMVVCLEARPQTIYQRLLKDTEYSASPVLRPLLAGDDPLQRIESLKSFRQPFYALADWTVHTDELTLEEVADEVVRGWHRWSWIQERKTSPGSLEVRTATDHYPIFVGWGLLEELGARLRQGGLYGAANIVSDETVFSLYGDRVKRVLEQADFRVNSCLVSPGESTKTMESVGKIYDFLLEHRVERNDVIVALGGGMVGDLAGFVAATCLRGLPLVQVPTSLVAMVDAAIGGKVAVDHPRGKNLIGAFYQPRLVLADVRTLTTLPQREFLSGWAEVIKHGLILDAGLFQLLEEKTEQLLAEEPDIITEVVLRSAAIKARVVSEDERERGRRTILNYGHTIAHGIETATRYERFLHGEAVSIGMVGAAMLSQRLGILSEEAVERQRNLLARFSLPTACPGVEPSAMLQAMELDKKVREGVVRWVLLQDIGQVILQIDVPQQDVVAVLDELIKP
jgi:3-dehydroquinate synthase